MKWYIFLPVLLVIAVIVVLSGCKKPAHNTDDVDGGVRHYVDTDAPKKIESTQIVSFSCEFSATNLALDSSPVAGRYYTLYAEQERGSYEARGDGDVYSKKEFTPDAAFFAALQQIVARYDLAQYNGQFYKVSGLPPDLGTILQIRYASGENISASNNQSCFLPLEAMEELVELFSQA